MANDEYTKRELDHFFGDFKRQLDRIEAQVIKTNGRTSVLENTSDVVKLEITDIRTRIKTIETYEQVGKNTDNIKVIQKWMYTVIGAIAILVFLIASDFINLGELI